MQIASPLRQGHLQLICRVIAFGETGFHLSSSSTALKKPDVSGPKFKDTQVQGQMQKPHSSQLGKGDPFVG